jgi:hypothetical protein
MKTGRLIKLRSYDLIEVSVKDGDRMFVGFVWCISDERVWRRERLVLA